MTPQQLLVLLKEHLTYDPETGIFTRGSEVAGGMSVRGYWRIRVGNTQYYAHRLAWLYMHGDWPKYQIDHIDRNKLNNRIDNLRDVPQHFNVMNAGFNSRNTSGYTGVIWIPEKKRWVARIVVNKRLIQLGSFTNKIKASLAYKLAKEQYHVQGI